eukprot:244459-Rhodomonas_salina.1
MPGSDVESTCRVMPGSDVGYRAIVYVVLSSTKAIVRCRIGTAKSGSEAGCISGRSTMSRSEAGCTSVLQLECPVV